MNLGMQVGLGPGHVVLDGTQLPFPKRGRSPPIFDPYLLWINGWMDQDATCYGDRFRPRRHCVRWGPSSSPRKGAQQPPPPTFRPTSIVAKRWPSDIIGEVVIIWRVRGKIIRSVLCNIVCNNCAQCNAHTYEPTNRSLGWVLSHWAHFTVLRFIFVYVCKCIFRVTVYCMNV